MSTSRVKLTKPFIDQLKLIPAIYRDSEIIGFAIRVNNSYKTYIVEKKVKGRSIRCKLGDYENITLEEARILAQQKLKDLSDPKHSTIKNNKILKNNLDKKNYQPDLNEAFQTYINHHNLKERTLVDYKEVIEKYLVDWGELKLIHITEQMIEDKYVQLSKSSYAKANLSMRVLRAVYCFSVKYYQDKNKETVIPMMNPVTFLNSKQLWQAVPPRNNYIDRENLTKWVHAIIEYQGRGQENETNKDFLLTLVLTGLFRNECECLRWEDLDLDEGSLSFINTYNNERYKIYMGDFLWHLMKKRKMKIREEWVFPSVKSKTGHIVNISKFRKKIEEQCNITFTFQDLRRTFNFVVDHLSDKPLFIRKADEKEKMPESINVAHDMRNRMNRVEQVVLGTYRDEFIKSITTHL
ncbi:integrase family protein [Acinetobacter sp. V110_1]|uniref:integrase family protein n=1 Tax=Acinetobacter sp. V110_1 TaxID=3072988 RepID=UPI00287F1DE0|nr:integrase family protein [Acinetobacter sp. V110_1]MDS7945055.1 integrase family protein [Acinetobacter sp. V110_1]